MAMENAKTIANSVYVLSIDSIRMALALTVALAWHQVVKQIVAKFPVGGNGIWAYILYAVIMTALLVVVAMFASKFLGLRDDSRPIVYAVTPQL